MATVDVKGLTDAKWPALLTIEKLLGVVKSRSFLVTARLSCRSVFSTVRQLLAEGGWGAGEMVCVVTEHGALWL